MISIRCGDCREILRTLPAASVHCVVTSPPYWGLRDYGTATWQGGDPGCDHIEVQPQGRPGRETPGGRGGSFPRSERAYKATCGHCGAIRIDAQLGLEPDFNAYVAGMVAVFREVRRVLRDDGTLWLNLGDSYAGSSMNGGTKSFQPAEPMFSGFRRDLFSLKPKDLCGIPWRVAFALQADGWYLRQDIIWSKPNPMPESVTDRCTKAHEYLFLLSKRERYYYDAEAIAEASVDPESLAGRHPRNGDAFTQSDPSGFARTRVGFAKREGKIYATRNKRSVWEVTTQPFSEAHFATFPPALIEPCIKAGTSERGCCGKCGKPWKRNNPSRGEDENDGSESPDWAYSPKSLQTPRNDGRRWNENNGRGFLPTQIKPLGWSPSCACAADPVPCTVLDPFAGAGTTGLVADRLQRSAVLIELNPDYAAMSEGRITDDAPLFAEVTP